MTRPKFRHPSDLAKPPPKEMIGVRVNPEARSVLEKAAEQHGLSLSKLASSVLEDYASWLEGQEGKKK